MKTSNPTTDLNAFDGPVLRGRDEVLHELTELSTRRVALLGESTEVTRLVARVAQHAGSLIVFQDEGSWVLPRAAGALPLASALLRPLPEAVRRRVTADLGRLHLHHGVADPWTRRQLTPRCPPNRTNVVYSDGHHRALRRNNVRLVTWPIAGFVPAGVRTADGIEHHIDVIAHAA